MNFLDIETDKDYVHFLDQSVPTYSVAKIVNTLKSLTAREILKRCPFVKKTLSDGEFWTDGYLTCTVGKHGDENMIGKDVKSQEESIKNSIRIINWRCTEIPRGLW